MAEQARLDMLGPQPICQKTIVAQLDLRRAQVIGGAPVQIERADIVVRKRIYIVHRTVTR